MYRTIVGTLIFLSALFAGIQAAAFVANVSAQFSLPADLPEPVPLGTDRRPLAPAEVRVSYIGINESTLRFLVYNGSTEKLSCLGYSGICASPELRINGLDASAWVCMNGSDIYEIMPGDTVEMMVGPYDFARVPGRDDEVAVGFKSVDNDTQVVEFAVPIVIPSAFRNEIRESLSEWVE
jgi:hypothetical protein